MVTSVSNQTATPTTTGSSLGNIGSSIVNSVTGGTIDIQSLATKLTDATKQPRQMLLDTRKAAAESKISAIGQITSAANDFQTSLDALGNSKAIAYSTQSTNPSIADFAFKSFIQPTPINFSFSVSQLATNNVVTLPPIAKGATSLLGSSTGRTLTLYSGQSNTSDSISTTTHKTSLPIPTGKLTAGDTYDITIPTDDGTGLTVSVTVPTSGSVSDFTDELNTAIAWAADAASLSSGYPTATVAANNKSISFDYGNSSTATGSLSMKPTTATKTFDLSEYDTLANFAAAINKVSGYSATVMNATSGSTAIQYLQISRGSGSDNNFVAEITDDSTGSSSGLSDGLNTTANGGAKSVAGQDAILVSSGVTYTSATNKFSNLISGVNINVHAITPGDSEVTLSTEDNTTAQLAALQTIVTGFNTLLSTVRTAMKYDSDVTKRGGLANDSIAKTFLSQLSALTTTPIKGSGTKSTSLSEIGIATNLDGTLKIDVPTIDRISQSNPQLITDVIASTYTSTGAIDLMAKLNKVITGTDSTFKSQLRTTQTTVEQAIADDQTKLDNEMTALQNRYLAQFTTMQALLNSTKSDQSSLTNMMSSWTAGMKG